MRALRRLSAVERAISKLLADVDQAQDDHDAHHHRDHQHEGADRSERVVSGDVVGEDHGARRRGFAAVDDDGGGEFAHDRNEDEDHADGYAGKRQWRDDLAEDLEGRSTHVARRLKQRSVDFGQREEDRSDGQHDVELYQRHGVAEFGIKEEAERLVDGAYANQELVDQSLAPKHRQPSDRANKVAGPERDHDQEKQRELPFEILHLHRQEIRHRVGQNQANRHGRDGEAKGQPQGADEDRRSEKIRFGGIKEAVSGKKGPIIFYSESRRHAVPSRFPKTENKDADQRQKKKPREP